MSFMSAPLLFIPGCSGFIGSHLLERILMTTDWRVLGVDKSCGKIGHLLSCDRLEFVQSDIYSCQAIGTFVKSSDVVISLAALCNPSLYNTIPITVIDNNFTQPRDLVRLCAEQGKRLIHFSTCEVYGRTLSSYRGGDGKETFREDESPYLLGPIGAQRWTYACAKQLLERLIYAYGQEMGLRYTIVRPFNFIGPRMDYIPGIDGDGVPRVVACFMEALLFNKPLRLVDGGRNRRVFTYIDDGIDAVMAIIEKPDRAERQVFNIGNPANELTIGELARRMAALYAELAPAGTSRAVEIVTASGKEFYGPGYEDFDRRIPDISKARERLGWIPKTAIDDTLRATIRAFVHDYAAASGLAKAAND
jgi:UDP-apiose/xylose synthase